MEIEIPEDFDVEAAIWKLIEILEKKGILTKKEIEEEVK